MRLQKGQGHAVRYNSAECNSSYMHIRSDRNCFIIVQMQSNTFVLFHKVTLVISLNNSRVKLNYCEPHQPSKSPKFIRSNLCWLIVLPENQCRSSGFFSLTTLVTLDDGINIRGQLCVITPCLKETGLLTSEHKAIFNVPQPFNKS